MTESESADVFRGYAKFYDALYAEKDYAEECRFLQRTLAANGVGSGSSILDLGCGTGSHLIPLVQAGYEVVGVDRSAEMIAVARRKARDAGVQAELVVGDVRDLALGRTFDVVVSMFAVVGYQLSNGDLASMFEVARSHLEPGGIFTFDAWFGPAVLDQKPKVARKTIELEDGTTLVRVATPTLDVVAQTVRVDYHLESDGANGQVEEVAESHTMRFLFAQEIAYFLEIAGFKVLALTPFMQEGVAPTEEDWNVTWVAQAI